MKKIYALLFALIPALTYAQFNTNVVEGDTFQSARVGTEIKIKMYIQNPPSAERNLQLRWRLLNRVDSLYSQPGLVYPDMATTTPSWTNYVCEGTLCYPASVRYKDFNANLEPGDSVAVYTYILMTQDTGTQESCLVIFDPNDSTGTVEEYCLTGHGFDFPEGINATIEESPVYLSQNSPNPFSDYTTISYEMKNGGELQIHDLTGKLIKTVVVPVGRRTITVGDLSPGMYFYSLWDEGQILATKRMLVVQ